MCESKDAVCTMCFTHIHVVHYCHIPANKLICCFAVGYVGPVWHNSALPVELFFRKQLHEQLHEWGRARAMFLQLHHVLNSVRVSFQRS
jgi:hypothetical protein